MCDEISQCVRERQNPPQNGAQNGISVLDWPAVLPSLNPIEQMWDKLSVCATESSSEHAGTWPSPTRRVAEYPQMEYSAFNQIIEMMSSSCY